MDYILNSLDARKALDKKFLRFPPYQEMQRPHKGWVKAIREALGMSAKQLANRMNVSQPRVTAIEKAELEDSLTLASLRSTAEAMDCALVYTFVPRKSLHNTVMNRAKLKARQIMGRVDHTMSLEDQSLNNDQLSEQIDELALDLINTKPRKLWDDDY